ncbi:unnamed protein product [Allacma fusca]|uniref:Caspase n=1 Tax=Allacma fusca TaxID=39272 RepID=A0A8J2L0R1_9HEXA|nr:unnamed protein product [Allacma fusca]
MFLRGLFTKTSRRATLDNSQKRDLNGSEEPGIFRQITGIGNEGIVDIRRSSSVTHGLIGIMSSRTGSVLPGLPVSKNNRYYNMDHLDRGRVIIFNFEEWDNTKFPGLNPRKGSAKDKNDLAKCFGDLDFDVLSYDNLNSHQFWKEINEVRDDDHSSRDCLVVVIMSHGEKNQIYAQDGTISVNKIWEAFQADKCPTLAGKPKIFIIQACRGHGYDNGTELHNKKYEFNPSPKADDDVTDSAPFSYVIPNAADVFIAFSCPLGQASWRNNMNGTWFIQAVCKVLPEKVYNTDLQTLFTHVAREVALNYETSSNDLTRDKKVQVSSTISTLIRIVKFSPKRVISHSPEIDKITEVFEKVIGNNKHELLLPNTAKFYEEINKCGHVGLVPVPENEYLLTNAVDS